MNPFFLVRVAAAPFALLMVIASAHAEPDPIRTLEGATRSLASAGDVRYDFTYDGHGSMAGHFSGTVRLKKADGDTPGAMWVSMQVPERHGGTSTPRELRIATSGPQIRLLDERRETVFHGTLNGGAGHLMSYAYYGVLFQFVQSDPFAIELGDSAIAYVGTESVNGVACDVVRAANNSYGGAEVHWLIGRDDHLPRGQRWEVTTPGVDGGFRFEISNLEAHAGLADADVFIETPKGYREIDEDARNVALGQPAPDWMLRAPEGGMVRLSDLRGRVVVLDFWASWCLPCWRLMPEFDAVARDFGGRGVRFFGVNSWESPEVDPAAFMKAKSIGYDLLLAGETIATDYKIGSLPAVFVVDRAGTIAYVNNPVMRSPGIVGGELRKAIEKALR